jgi:hypothetical protein
MPRAISMKATGTSDTFVFSLLSAAQFFKIFEGRKFVTLRKPDNDQKIPQNLRPISPLSTTSKLFEKVILKILQGHTEERGLLNASQFGFHACHSKTLQCMRLTDHVTLNFNTKISAAV